MTPQLPQALRAPWGWLPAPRWSIGAAIFWALVLAVTIPWRLIHPDDGWLVDYTHYVSELGHARTHMFGEYHGYTDRLLVWHKGWVVQGALLARVVGLHMTPLKLLAVLYGVSALAVLYRLARVWGADVSVGAAAVGLVLFHPLFFELAGIYRPEMAVTFAGLVSLLALLAHVQTDRLWLAVAAGAAAGLGALFHLNGLCLIMATIGTLALMGRWGPALAAGVAGGAVTALYLSDMLGPGALELFQNQLAHDPALKPGSLSWYAPLLRLLHEGDRYFKTWRESFFAASLVLMGLAAGGVLWRQARPMVLWLGLGMLGLSLLSRDAVPYYSVYFMPLMGLLWALGWRMIRPQSQWQQGALWVSLAMMIVHLLGGAASNAYLIARPRGMDTYRDMSRALEIVGGDSLVGSPELPALRPPDPGLRIYQAYGKRDSVKGSFNYHIDRAPADGFRYALIDIRLQGSQLSDTTGWLRVYKGRRFDLWQAVGPRFTNGAAIGGEGR